ncbi:transthyretin-like protein [Grosmannia clavigera kw1407]|uniref:Transthyretin-like protein n=1 Tax=Grosmannia clavigera (strain kw1407 / UAMH 11150) TaxID=655863 RepID=F0XLL1_GROCL|nr:transthyretin-like protein [Grosmannia clavigera kw1407]EFX00991.1 transthyretin-like protein [Grosmannia clavigera kw1407]
MAATKERITCHILDTSKGSPARGVRVRLELTAPRQPPATASGTIEAPGGHHYHGGATKVFESQTNDDGRVTVWLPYSSSNASGEVPVYTLDDVLGEAEEEAAARSTSPLPSTWTLRFDVDGYYGVGNAFFPEVAVTFRVAPGQHYHVPLLLNPFSYTTYRGS